MEKRIFKFLTRATSWVQMIAGTYLATCAVGLAARLFSQGRLLAGGVMAVVAAGCLMLLIESIKEYRANLRQEKETAEEEEEEH